MTRTRRPFPKRRGRTRTRPMLGGQALDCLAVHQVLTTAHLQELLLPANAPAAGRRRIQQALAGLHAQGWAAWLPGPRNRPRTWYCTPAGLLVAEVRAAQTGRVLAPAVTIPDPAAYRRRLAANDLGVDLVRWARVHRDEFGPFGWRHHVAYPLPAVALPAALRVALPDAGQPQPAVLAPSALLRLTLRVDSAQGMETRFLDRFVDLDTPAEPVQVLGDRLRAYRTLYTHIPRRAKQPAWQDHHAHFPAVWLVVRTHRRLRALVALCNSDPQVRAACKTITPYAVVASDLHDRGYRAAVFTNLATGKQVDILGRSVAEAVGEAGTR